MRTSITYRVERNEEGHEVAYIKTPYHAAFIDQMKAIIPYFDRDYRRVEGYGWDAWGTREWGFCPVYLDEIIEQARLYWPNADYVSETMEEYTK